MSTPTVRSLQLLAASGLLALASCASQDVGSAKPVTPMVAKAPPAYTPVAPPAAAAKSKQPIYVSTGRTMRGQASWYAIACNGGTQTASGERLRDYGRTAAHKTLPMGTRVRVTNTRNGKSAVVKINDRGPYTKGRIIDVTKGVAQDLGMITSGVAPVKVEILKKTPTVSSEASTS